MISTVLGKTCVQQCWIFYTLRSNWLAANRSKDIGMESIEITVTEDKNRENINKDKGCTLEW